MKIEASDRILIFAPHPDDEALATGGLLQRAAAVGAAVQIVFATDGENNPWPHRVLERRWKIQPIHRKLWASRRADEALASLATLGIPAACAEFLHLPDQRITELFLRERIKILAQLAQIIERIRPSLVVAPSLFDLHPDHSALHLFVRAALVRARQDAVKQLYYMVHTRGYHSDWSRTAIALTPGEQEKKKRAILCHKTQIALSRSRFLGHAKPIEEFWEIARSREIDLHHPVRGGRFAHETLVLQLQRRKRSRSFGSCTLLLGLENGSGSGKALRIQLRGKSGKIRMVDARTSALVGSAELDLRGTHAQLAIPLQSTGGSARLFAKLNEPSVFFDSAGWREIPITDSAVSSMSHLADSAIGGLAKHVPHR